MVKANGQFQKGYQDGARDAQRSWTDWRGADMWLWGSDRQYKQGYDRGWKDGRQMAKLKDYQNKQLGTREPLTPTPSLNKQQRLKPSTGIQPSAPIQPTRIKKKANPS